MESWGASERVAGLRKLKSRLGISFGRRLTGCIIPLMAVGTVRIALPIGVAMLGDWNFLGSCVSGWWEWMV